MVFLVISGHIYQSFYEGGRSVIAVNFVLILESKHIKYCTQKLIARFSLFFILCIPVV